jgi:hypothetical protein
MMPSTTEPDLGPLSARQSHRMKRARTSVVYRAAHGSGPRNSTMSLGERGPVEPLSEVVRNLKPRLFETRTRLGYLWLL